MTTMMASIPPAGKKVKPKPLREVLEKVLQQLQRRDQYLFFAQPVSAAEVPNYYEFIKEPMDLGTMQGKLEGGAYTSLDSFKNDFLLVTGNAQYFNSLNGPSAIVHTEAKKLEEWGLKALAKEAPAVEEALAIEAAEAAAQARQRQQLNSNPSSKPRLSGGPRLSLKIRANSALNSSGSATPRLSTPSGLQYEVKVEQGDHDTTLDTADSDDENRGMSYATDDDEDEDGNTDDEDEDDDGDDDDEDDEDDDDDDEETEDDDMSSTNRADSMSLDGSIARRSKKASEGITVKKKRRSGARRKKNGLFGKKQARNSSIVALLSIPPNPNELASKVRRRPRIARVNTASGAVAAQIPLVYRHDGAINLEKLTEDERTALLRPSGLDSLPDVTIPFLHSLAPLHPDLLPNAQALERDLKHTVDGFGAAVAESSYPNSHSFSYNLDGRAPEQHIVPFNTSSGWSFGRPDPPRIPIAWPRMQPSTNVNNESSDRESGQPGVRPPRKDRERERDEEGLANLDDWTWPRAHLTRLQDSLDVGLYTGLLPATWALHINSQKGGPTKSRLPPFHLAAGSAFEAALLDELASLPHRALMGAKPGIIPATASQPKPPPSDVTVAIQQAAERDWMPASAEVMRLGARGTDLIREVVYGGPLGEAYASSLEDFARGASRAALEVEDEEGDDETQVDSFWKDVPGKTAKEAIQAGIPPTLNKVPAAYFDEDGELFDQDAYIGVDLIPVEVRKEAGMTADAKLASSRKSPTAPASDLPRGVKRSRSTSIVSTPPLTKRQSPAEDAHSTPDVKAEGDAGAGAEDDLQGDSILLESSLIDYVRDVVLTPITHGHLHILIEISKALQSDKESSDDVEQVVKSENTEQASSEEQQRRIEEELARKTRRTITAMLQGKQHKGKLQMHELIRAQGNAVDVDRLVGGESDLISVLKLEAEGKEKSEHGILNPNADVDQVLKAYAAVLSDLSDRLKQGGGLSQEELARRNAKVDRLRIAFVSLTKRMSRLHVVNGQWTKWLDKAAKQKTELDKGQAVRTGLQG